MKIPKFLNTINVMYLPAVILFVLFVFYPFMFGINLSFYSWDGFSANRVFVGIQNYINILDDKIFWVSLKNTLLYGFLSTFFQQILGLSFALLLHKTFKLRVFTRLVIYLPALISGLIMGYIWYFLFQYNGALNDLLYMFGLPEINWLGKPKTAIAVIIFINSIQFCGVSMLIYLAGLQSVPESLIEAAEIDGGSKRQIFINVTIPLLTPAITTSVILNLIGGLKLFDVIVALTNGEPGSSTHSLSTLIQYTYFNKQSAGYAASIGICLFALILIVSLLFNSLFKKVEVSE